MVLRSEHCHLYDCAGYVYDRAIAPSGLARTLVDGALRASGFCFIRSLNGSYRRR
jgi:hypothetical protein